ncbi:ABC transporter ATP-binding protein [Saccharibacillus sp. JS10]|uniref:ABC transporter ATP-binding protein n=1 Tax=Saccharibacillus sp. JS10 TaxID=2950552 RepID=UPI00210CA5E9|nr:ABC transporter ATP-binding protein [Saccharibacillus sp. JS10]MCQ4086802.1 ABC transporter ATP-binding protein [Saccharibacillus sp. JS10]
MEWLKKKRKQQPSQPQPTEHSPALQLLAASCRYEEHQALYPLDWTVQPQEFWVVLGPNGSGKSSLLDLISGTTSASSGSIHINGRPFQHYGRRELAQSLAVLPQEGLPPLGITVQDALEMGRFPYRDPFGREPDPQSANVLLARIAQRLSLTDLLDRRLDELSGGQRQRVALGQVMAQQPSILLLDEPTAYLDIHYQLDLMEWVQEWRAEGNLTVIAVLHDVNLAAQYAEYLLLLRGGKVVAQGTPQQVLTADIVGALYDIQPPTVIHHETIAVPQMLFRASPDEDSKS